MVATTARYIGLRTYRYRPPTTRRSVGATGAGVPRPSATNRAKAWTRTIAPRMSMISPATRTGAQWASGPRTCHRVSHQGTTPATTPGAAAKNSVLPTAAAGLRMQTVCARRPARARRCADEFPGPWPSSLRGVRLGGAAPTEGLKHGAAGCAFRDHREGAGEAPELLRRAVRLGVRYELPGRRGGLGAGRLRLREPQHHQRRNRDPRRRR